MRKLILFAATAAMALPSAAIAERHHERGDRDRHESHYVRHGDREGHGHRDWHGGRTYHSDRSYHGDSDWHGDRDHRHVSYVAPYRHWHYRPVTVGYRLSPVYYSQRYYIGDYGHYHVHAPRPWERWIRYGDDLLLVNIRTGRVLDVIPYRYW